MKKKGKMAACLILLVLLLAVLVVLTKKNSTADADSSSSDSGADAEKVVDFSKDDVTALSFQAMCLPDKPYSYHRSDKYSICSSCSYLRHESSFSRLPQSLQPPETASRVQNRP